MILSDHRKNFLRIGEIHLSDFILCKFTDNHQLKCVKGEETVKKHQVYNVLYDICTYLRLHNVFDVIMTSRTRRKWFSKILKYILVISSMVEIQKCNRNLHIKHFLQRISLTADFLVTYITIAAA